MMLSLDTAYRSFGGEVEALSNPTIAPLPDPRRHQLSAIAQRYASNEKQSLIRNDECLFSIQRDSPSAYRRPMLTSVNWAKCPLWVIRHRNSMSSPSPLLPR